MRELYTSDTKAIDHIVSNTDLYGRGPVSVRIFQNLLGNGEISLSLSLFSPKGSMLPVGILSVEGDVHKQQASIQLVSIIYVLILVLKRKLLVILK
jgi:hypothetical protein